MRDIIRSGCTGRRALKLVVVLVVSMTVCQGPAVCQAQESPAAQSAADVQGAKQVLPTQPAVVPPQADTVPPAESKPAQPVQAAPAPVDQPAAPSEPPKGKGKGSKNDKNSGSGEAAATGVQAKPYEIGPEDILYLNVLHQPDVSSQLSVRPDGFVSVRFANEIKAAGLTTQQLADIVADKLTQYFNHPEVNIQVLKINSKKYYISGEVKKPGAYTLSTPKTILEAIIEAGGPADFAKKKGVYVLRKHQRIAFNFNEVSKGKKLEQNILLENGDVIVVP